MPSDRVISLVPPGHCAANRRLRPDRAPSVSTATASPPAVDPGRTSMTVAPPAGALPARRSVIGAAGAAAAVAAAAPAAPATAARGFRPARHRGAPLLGRPDRLLVGRFSYGLTPALARQVRQHGG